jgi:protein required for attachment to host cells
MSRNQVTWFVIADGMHARVLKQDAPRGALVPALEHELVEPKVQGFSRDLGDDRPGRAFDPGSGGRHAMEPRSDPHMRMKQAFARRVAELINQGAGRGAFEHLVLVAPPRTLGELRAELDPGARRRILTESAKDLMKIPQAELGDHLADIVADAKPSA